ncbi:MAG TPA: bifunctional 5,10-methylene-tetrahydrofolate dehydrogenase/5,10-methylene-tetrahydrofolate cyclohydrolase [Candidatus Dorea gallistercoris]|uniref:Bifunctional protein FolD n=1 Tax=Candidatus Dorea gallistercoris TaxID=2838542 RepID=A0A9D1RD89_9FIRM|nr:bifunctional 5,10-methylene-tetrahydrofolate dehydrogenase/5,10-methylene-tetrahydrofolate cyclohydrolase [Candidatus Dorea gallistercoris]
MSTVMMGTDVAKSMKEDLIRRTEELKRRGISPKLCIVRVGSRPDDLAYERGAKKRMELVGIDCQVLELTEDISQAEFEAAFQKVNQDPGVHGILLFRPLPAHLDEEPVKALIDPRKDVDGMSAVNLAKVFAGDETGFAPCTAEAVMAMLEAYGIDLKGKRAVVVGRSMVIGKPVAMLLLKKHATVTICHTRTEDLKGTCRQAQILIAAAGKAKMISGDMVGVGAVVADVGINVDEEGNLCGDVDFEEAKEKASYISPVPKGVGSVTTSVLADHVLRGAGYLADL